MRVKVEEVLELKQQLLLQVVLLEQLLLQVLNYGMEQVGQIVRPCQMPMVLEEQWELNLLD
jgi:hypothetical protein